MADTTANLFGDATQALQGASQTADAANQIKQKDRSDSVAAGSQALSDLDKQHLAKMQSQLDQANNMMTITPQIGMGLVKNTGDKEWLKAIGQKMRADVVIAMYTHGINTKISQKPITAMVGKNKVTFTPSFDDQGQLQLSQIASDEGATQEVADKKADAAMEAAKNKGTKGSDSPDKDMDKWFKNANTARKEIQDTFTKKGGMPKTGKVHDIVSMFKGGDPENDARIASLKQNYSDYKTAVDNYNQLAEKNGKSPMNIDPSVSAAMDKVMALPGAKSPAAGGGGGASDPRDAAKQYLQSHNIPVTDANIDYYLKNK